MIDLIEGPESGHPENEAFIKHEIEHESSLGVFEAKTRNISYKMAKETGYRYHFILAGLLVFATLLVTAGAFKLVAYNELDAQGAIVVGNLIGVWQAAALVALNWVYGSSMSSQNKSRIMESRMNGERDV